MRHGKVTRLFLQARELPESERASFLDQACAGDLELREELNSLLSHDHELGSTMSEHLEVTTPRESHRGQDRFLPGTVLADRYRIVALLGRGGMGEVYRTDDLKLDQSVALKFLAQTVTRDEDLLNRMRNEVRLSRQIAHPNVCHVYDVGEADGLHFFSMEYVDGEDLESLLRRIGRLPRDKALQIARELVSGLAAAHDLGILHRDLKPANIMIDGRGSLKITDFGLATLPEDVTGREIAVGTPGYMAPEQLAGQQVTVRSDLYSLGLVLYRLFTGRSAFTAQTMTELRLEQHRSTPVDPSSIVEGLDLAVVRGILACLAPDPRDRPASAREVLAALPGGDPLSAALKAGETPSPELVAAAKAETGMTEVVGIVCLVATVLGLLLLAGLSGRTMLFAREPLELPPDALEHTARQILDELAPAAPSRDSARGFSIDAETLGHREEEPGDPRSGGLPAVHFWYRSSPEMFRPEEGSANIVNPSVVAPGLATVVLGSDGRLMELQAAPRAGAGADAGSPDWAAAFRRAGLDPEQFREASELHVPPVLCDECRAWSEKSEGVDSHPLRVRAGGVGGRLTYFQVVPPWRESLLARRSFQHGRAWSARGLYDGLYIIVILACVIVARRNLRFGRGDKRGATRLALYVFTVTLVSGLLSAHHVSDAESERHILAESLGLALFTAAFLCWIPYIALEPYLRRTWPHRIVSWTRLLAGRFRDPLVGRDLMIGVLIAVVTQLLLRVYGLAPGWLGLAAPRPDEFWVETLQGFRYSLVAFLELQPQSVFLGLGLLLLLLGFRTFTRSLWIAAPLVVVLATMAWHPEVSMLHPAIGLTITALRIGTFVFVMLRFGVLAGIVAMFFDGVLTVFPLTLDMSVWYLEASLLAGGSAIAVATWGLRHALAGRFASPAPARRTVPG